MRSAAHRPASSDVVGPVVRARPSPRRTRRGSRPRARARPCWRARMLAPKRADLAAGVVDVVLAGDLVAGALEQPGRARRRRRRTSRCRRGAGRWGWPRRTRPSPARRRPMSGGRSRRRRSRPRRASTSCSHVSARRKFTKPGPGDLDALDVGGQVARFRRSASCVASSRGLRPAPSAVARATFDDQSPCSGTRGARARSHPALRPRAR